MNIKAEIRSVVRGSMVLSALELAVFKKRWRRRNSHNLTTAANCFDVRRVTVGKGTYGNLDVRHFGNPSERVQIGNYCSIGPECVFMTGGEHPYDRLSTYPFRMKLGMDTNESVCRGPIVLEDDVWLGFRSIIMSGVRIGRGAVVAAGAVVTKDVPPYAIVGGVPAKIIKYRFPESVIHGVKKVDYAMLNAQKVRENILYFDTPLTVDNASDIIKELGF